MVMEKIQKMSNQTTTKHKLIVLPWPGGSVVKSVILYNKRLWVRSLVRTHTKIEGLIPGQGEFSRLPTDVSLHLSLSLSLSPPLPLSN